MKNYDDMTPEEQKQWVVAKEKEILEEIINEPLTPVTGEQSDKNLLKVLKGQAAQIEDNPNHPERSNLPRIQKQIAILEDRLKES